MIMELQKLTQVNNRLQKKIEDASDKKTPPETSAIMKILLSKSGRSHLLKVGIHEKLLSLEGEIRMRKWKIVHERMVFAACNQL